jgi:Ni/Co efflux regulator RcnB
MNKLLSALIVIAFAAASFSAVAQDNELDPEQADTKKETTELQIKKEAASQRKISVKSAEKYTDAHWNGKTVSSKRRPMFK